MKHLKKTSKPCRRTSRKPVDLFCHGKSKLGSSDPAFRNKRWVSVSCACHIKGTYTRKLCQQLPFATARRPGWPPPKHFFCVFPQTREATAFQEKREWVIRELFFSGSWTRNLICLPCQVNMEAEYSMYCHCEDGNASFCHSRSLWMPDTKCIVIAKMEIPLQMAGIDSSNKAEQKQP